VYPFQERSSFTKDPHQSILKLIAIARVVVGCRVGSSLASLRLHLFTANCCRFIHPFSFAFYEFPGCNPIVRIALLANQFRAQTSTSLQTALLCCTHDLTSSSSQLFGAVKRRMHGCNRTVVYALGAALLLGLQVTISKAAFYFLTWVGYLQPYQGTDSGTNRHSIIYLATT
jgi:hypothetical protein